MMQQSHPLLDFPLADPAQMERIHAFCETARRHYPDLATETVFPRDLWEMAATAGIFETGIPPSFGGCGGGLPEMAAAGAALAAGCGSLGFTLSVMLHQLTARSVLLQLGTPRQKAAWLPAMAKGRGTLSMAVSEPSGGAHPKYIRTEAKKTATGYRITGEKTFITNAGIADLFLVVAVTGVTDGKNAFTAFLVPRKQPGLTITDLPPLPFFRPSPHGALHLHGVEVPENAVLGNVGTIYQDLIKPFRSIEDALMTGPVTGGIAALLTACCEEIRNTPSPASPLQVSAIGQAHARITAACAMAERAVRATPPSLVSQDLNIAFRQYVQSTILDLQKAMEEIPLSPRTRTLFNDLEKSGAIAAKTAVIHQDRTGLRLLGQVP